jgi:anti-sigma factor RsiW
MDEHIDELLPFYFNKTLNESQSARVQAHLSACTACREALEAWADIASATAAEQRGTSLPRLSPLVQASLHRRPSLRQATASAAHLIWSQRVFIAKNWLLPSLGSLIGSGALAALMFSNLAKNWANVPLFAIVPMAAALTSAFLYTFEDDPTRELIAAAPTSLATLLFARLSLALGTIGLMGFAGSLLATLLGQGQHSLLEMVAAWLGPMLLLSALTTVFSLRLHPRVASGAALGLWGLLLILLFAEQAGAPLLRVSLIWLLQPGWALFAGQALLAGLLWLGAWLWLNSHLPAHIRPEGRV